MNVKITAGSLVTVSNWFFNWVIIYSFNFMMQWSASGKILPINKKILGSLYFDIYIFFFLLNILQI